MPDDVSIVIGTFGDFDFWSGMAERAIRSAENQTVAPRTVIWAHHENLQMARNQGASQVQTEWCIFLDADDELDPRYVESMLKADGDIRRPSTLGVYEDGSTDVEAVMIPKTDLRSRNCIVIGAMHRRDMFDAVGGFRDLPALEDWDLWRRMVAGGAQVGDVNDAIYKVHVRPASRNLETKVHNAAYTRILHESPL